MAPLPIARGRRFKCTACGNCCVQDGYVFVSDEEIARMAAHLGLDDATFRARFEVHRHPVEESWVLEARDGRGCPLLTPTRGCSVHAVKPAQCATWPFWSDMLEDATLWQEATSYCPGMDAPNGRRYTRDEILQISRGERGT